MTSNSCEEARFHTFFDTILPDRTFLLLGFPRIRVSIVAYTSHAYFAALRLSVVAAARAQKPTDELEYPAASEVNEVRGTGQLDEL